MTGLRARVKGGRRQANNAGRALQFAPRLLTAKARSLPDFLIIGAQRSGTKTLYRYLARHSKVVPSFRNEEIHFFDENLQKGTAWYRAFFPLRRSLPAGGITGEKSPYYIFHPRVPKLAARCLEDGRFIAILRDPARRAFSHYLKEVRNGREPLDFRAALDLEEERLAGEKERMLNDPTYNSFSYGHYSYKARGVYADQLEEWFAEVDRERFLILKSESLFKSPAATSTAIQGFLRLPHEDLGALPHRNRTPGGVLDPGTREALEAYFEPHNGRLCRLLGWETSW